MNAITYYAVKGMIASAEMDAVETLTKRLSMIAEHRPELTELLIEGVAVSARIISTGKLCKLLGVKTVENAKCRIITGGDLHQEIYVEYDYEGKHMYNAYPLPLDTERLENIFDVEYIQSLGQEAQAISLRPPAFFHA